jgi:hypothetical protein
VRAAKGVKGRSGEVWANVNDSSIIFISILGKNVIRRNDDAQQGKRFNSPYGQPQTQTHQTRLWYQFSTTNTLNLLVLGTVSLKKQRPAESRRRSSFSLRGKRKSSFGELQSTLHPDIQPQDFCQHISPELPDPVRMRQLLVYGLQHHLHHLGEDAVSVGVAEVLESALLQPLLTKKLQVSWYHRPREQVVLVTKPNPQNVEIKSRLGAMLGEIERVRKQSEKYRSWRMMKQEKETKKSEKFVADLGAALEILSDLNPDVKHELGHQVNMYYNELEQIKNMDEVEHQVRLLLYHALCFDDIRFMR